MVPHMLRCTCSAGNAAGTRVTSPDCPIHGDASVPHLPTPDQEHQLRKSAAAEKARTDKAHRAAVEEAHVEDRAHDVDDRRDPLQNDPSRERRV